MRKLTQQDTDSIIGAEISGYRIIKARIKRGEFSDSDHYGILFGRNKLRTHVTWQYHHDDGQPSVYWGHYMESETAALRDFDERDA